MKRYQSSSCYGHPVYRYACERKKSNFCISHSSADAVSACRAIWGPRLLLELDSSETFRVHFQEGGIWLWWEEDNSKFIPNKSTSTTSSSSSPKFCNAESFVLGELLECGAGLCKEGVVEKSEKALRFRLDDYESVFALCCDELEDRIRHRFHSPSKCTLDIEGIEPELLRLVRDNTLRDPRKRLATSSSSGNPYSTTGDFFKFDSFENDLKLGPILRPYQREAVRFALRRNVRALIADEMGLGKSLSRI